MAEAPSQPPWTTTSTGCRWPCTSGTVPRLGEHSAEGLAHLVGVDAGGYEEFVRLGISGEDPPE